MPEINNNNLNFYNIKWTHLRTRQFGSTFLIVAFQDELEKTLSSNMSLH